MTLHTADRVDTVLVPLDGSAFSERAIPVATWLADRLQAAIHLLSAVPTYDDIAERQRLLDKVDIPELRVERSVVLDRDVAGAIHEALRRLGNAVACMASHGRDRSAALVGSVATEVVTRGHDPLVVCGPRVEVKHLGASVVACVDATPEAAELVRIALRWAALLRKRAIVICVAEPVPPAITAGPVRRRFGPNDDVDGYLEWLVAPFRAKGAELETHAVYDPISPADGVQHYLRDHPACLVVIASRARSGLARIVFGSTSADIVYRSPAPALVVPRQVLDAA